MANRLEPESLPRRDFLSLAGLLAAGAAIFGSLLGMARLPKPRVLPEASDKFKLGAPDQFSGSSGQVLTGKNVYVESGAQGVAVISMVCTHLGCIVAKTEQGFSCPCHGSKYTSDGRVIAGPAPRALKWLKVSRAPNGSLVVDGGQEVPPGTFFKV